MGLFVEGVLFDQWYDTKSTGVENAPETLRRLFEGRNEGKQLLRGVVRPSKWGCRQRPPQPKPLKPVRASSNLRGQSVLTNV